MQDWPSVLRELPSLGFGFMLVLARVGTALLTGPGLGENDIPPTIRGALAALFAALVFPVLRGALPPAPQDVAGLIGPIGLEACAGAWIGFMTRVMVAAMGMAGTIISLMVGLSSVLQIDPSVGTQVPAMERLLALAAIALLFATGLYLLPVQAILGSYDILPPGAAFDAGGAAGLVARAVSGSFALALQLAAPFVITSIVWQAAMGFLGRLVPNIQVHVVSAPAQIIGGLALLSLAIGAMISNWTAGVTAAFATLPGL